MSFSEEFLVQMYSEVLESYEKLLSLAQNPSTNATILLEHILICMKKMSSVIELDSQPENFPIFHSLNSELNTMLQLIALMSNKDRPPEALDQKKSNSLVESTVEVPKVEGFKAIAGLDEVKSALKTLVVLPKMQPQLFKYVNICNSILLYGPPGTGKTRIVHALAAEAKATLHCVFASDLLSPFSGESEKTIQNLFKSIKEKQCYTILFIDEIDGLCTKRSSTEQNHSRRLKTELMCQFSRMDDSPNVFIICATNCPWDLDTAILRRFKRRFYIPLPDRRERYELLKFFTRDTPLDTLESNNLIELLDMTDGYSGSDLSNVIQYAFSLPLIELQNTSVWKITGDGIFEPLQSNNFSKDESISVQELDDIPPNCVITRAPNYKDIIQAVTSMSATVPTLDIKHYEDFNRMFN